MKPPKYFYFRVKADIEGITLEDASDVDVAEIVRCKDCKRYGGRQWENYNTGICSCTDSSVGENDFC